MTDREKKPAFPGVLASLLGFVLLWAAVTDAWGYSELLGLNKGSYAYAYFSRLVWVAPAAWLIFRYGGCLRYGRPGLFSRPKLNKTLAAVLAASAVFALTGMFVRYHWFRINRAVHIPLEVIKLALVGIVEETVFRGWGFNALCGVVSDKKAVFHSTLCFVLLHWPAYLIKLCRFGAFDLSAWLMQSLTVAVWGVICCALLKKSRTLWNPIIAHALYDVLYVILVE